MRVRTAGGTVENVLSQVLVDASGQSTFLANAGILGEKIRGNYDHWRFFRRSIPAKVQEALTEYLEREIVAKNGLPLPTLDQPLFGSRGGVIDSLNMWALDRFRRNQCGITIEETDLLQENFQNLRALINFIKTKLEP